MSLALLLGTELKVDVAEGHEVIGLSSPGPYVPEIESWGVAHAPLPSLTRSWDPRRDVAATRELWHAVRSLQPDVLHTHNPKTGVIGRIVGRLARVPVVVNTCHGLWASSDDSPGKRRMVHSIEGVAAQFSHFELFQNEADRRTLRWAVGESRARVVGNGVDLARFRFDAGGRARVRAELGVPPDDVLIGSVGRRVAEKGIADLAAAAASLGAGTRVIWVGPEDPDKPDRVMGGFEAMTFIDERSDMPAVYSAFDVFVLPSHREGFSRSAMEAAACGRAMVLTDIRGCREIGTHDEHLLLVAPRDPVALARALTTLASDATLRRRLGDAAANRARMAFDQREVARISLETYAEVARRKGLRW